MCTVCAWCPKRPEEDIRSPGIRIPNDCEPPLGARNQSGSSGRAPSTVLTTEPSLQKLKHN